MLSIVNSREGKTVLIHLFKYPQYSNMSILLYEHNLL